MARRARSLPFLIALAACLPSPPTATPPSLTRFGVTPTLAPRVIDLLQAYREEGLGMELDLQVISYPAAMRALEEGTLQGLITLQPPPGDWFATPLGVLPLAAVVHENNPITALNAEQLRAIFAGQIQDWAELEGRPGPIQPVAPLPGSDLRWALQRALGLERFASYALLAANGESVVSRVADDPQAIGVAPREALNGPVRPLRLPEANGPARSADLQAHILAIAPAEPPSPLLDFLIWIQRQSR